MNSAERVSEQGNVHRKCDEKNFLTKSAPPSRRIESKCYYKSRTERMPYNRRTKLEEGSASVPSSVKYKTLSAVAAKASLPFDTENDNSKPQSKPMEITSKSEAFSSPARIKDVLKDDLRLFSQNQNARQHFRSLGSGHYRELAISKYQRQREQEQLNQPISHMNSNEQEKRNKIPSNPQSEESSSSKSHDSASPLPFNGIDVAVASPHVAPHVVDGKNGIPLRQRIMNNYDNAIFPPSDYFRSFMEERMMRWRPPDSQFNIEETMEGHHPFQINDETGVQKLTSKNYWNEVFSLVKNWFTGEPEVVPDLENQDVVVPQDNRDLNGRGLSLRRSVSRVNLDNTDFNSYTLDLLKRAKEIPFQANSSNSFIPPHQQPSNEGHSTNNVTSRRNSGVNKEPTHPEDPIFTPRGSPFAESVLNFEKREAKKSSMDQEGIVIFNALDEDVRDLLNTFDNFFCNFWDSATKYCAC